jgi:hypothetical protein
MVWTYPAWMVDGSQPSLTGLEKWCLIVYCKKECKRGDDMIQATSPERKVFVDFALHVFWGGVSFLLVLLVAVIIGVVARWLESHGYVSENLSTITHIVEPVLYVLDLILFILLTVAEGLNLILGLLRKHGT